MDEPRHARRRRSGVDRGRRGVRPLDAVSPNGRLDGFEWKLPLAEIGVSRPVIEMAPPPAPAKPEPAESVPEASIRKAQKSPAKSAGKLKSTPSRSSR